ncbi:hypothetical protein PPACK8108_LOCUS20723 [Phakopsora pachyrhizi]|uniref:Uncharacterized protein n=1 Tax=Phakopsora pachyrhizi TaxID=170000 RepID=A0AAV0BIG9_PHAPC|nr:hypothetical protein PPACK8108_LOCUS20723 [Phakopsora pachyrhizi]
MSLTTSVLGVKLLQEQPYTVTLNPTRRSLYNFINFNRLSDAGGLLDFNPQTSWIREDLTWQAASPAPGLVSI